MTTTARECWRVAAQWKRESTASTRDDEAGRDRMSEIALGERLSTNSNRRSNNSTQFVTP